MQSCGGHEGTWEELHQRRLAGPHHAAAGEKEARARLVGQGQVHQQVVYSRQDGTSSWITFILIQECVIYIENRKVKKKEGKMKDDSK
jgi:hypothetical protein